jgi:hypothetical protein
MLPFAFLGANKFGYPPTYLCLELLSFLLTPPKDLNSYLSRQVLMQGSLEKNFCNSSQFLGLLVRCSAPQPPSLLDYFNYNLLSSSPKSWMEPTTDE